MCKTNHGALGVFQGDEMAKKAVKKAVKKVAKKTKRR